jgi:hypothetical protein
MLVINIESNMTARRVICDKRFVVADRSRQNYIQKRDNKNESMPETHLSMRIFRHLAFYGIKWQ